MKYVRADGVHAVSFYPPVSFYRVRIRNLFSSVSWSSAGACGFREGTVDKV